MFGQNEINVVYTVLVILHTYLETHAKDSTTCYKVRQRVYKLGGVARAMPYDRINTSYAASAAVRNSEAIKIKYRESTSFVNKLLSRENQQ